jgi:hypothetical protein
LSPKHEDLRGERYETLSLFWGEIDAGLLKVPPKRQGGLMCLAAESADNCGVRQNVS